MKLYDEIIFALSNSIPFNYMQKYTPILAFYLSRWCLTSRAGNDERHGSRLDGIFDNIPYVHPYIPFLTQKFFSRILVVGGGGGRGSFFTLSLWDSSHCPWNDIRLHSIDMIHPLSPPLSNNQWVCL